MTSRSTELVDPPEDVVPQPETMASANIQEWNLCGTTWSAMFLAQSYGKWMLIWQELWDTLWRTISDFTKPFSMHVHSFFNQKISYFFLVFLKSTCNKQIFFSDGQKKLFWNNLYIFSRHNQFTPSNIGFRCIRWKADLAITYLLHSFIISWLLYMIFIFNSKGVILEHVS